MFLYSIESKRIVIGNFKQKFRNLVHFLQKAKIPHETSLIKKCQSPVSLQRMQIIIQVRMYKDCIHSLDIEKQWAVKAFHHAETYFSLISKFDAASLKLTRLDDEIYEDFKTQFPDLDVQNLDEMRDFKNEAAKAKWRDFIMKYDDFIINLFTSRYEKRVQDYNFGTLLRNRSAEDYGEHNCFFGES